MPRKETVLLPDARATESTPAGKTSLDQVDFHILSRGVLLHECCESLRPAIEVCGTLTRIGYSSPGGGNPYVGVRSVRKGTERSGRMVGKPEVIRMGPDRYREVVLSETRPLSGTGAVRLVIKGARPPAQDAQPHRRRLV